MQSPVSTFPNKPSRVARQKTAGRGLSVRFLVEDALKLGQWTERFENDSAKCGGILDRPLIQSERLAAEHLFDRVGDRGEAPLADRTP